MKNYVIPFLVGIGVCFFFCYMMSYSFVKSELNKQEQRIRSEFTSRVKDSIVEKVMRTHDKDLIGVVTYSDNLGWINIDFIDEGTRNYINSDGIKEKTVISVQINGEYKVGTRFWLVPEK